MLVHENIDWHANPKIFCAPNTFKIFRERTINNFIKNNKLRNLPLNYLQLFLFLLAAVFITFFPTGLTSTLVLTIRAIALTPRLTNH